MNTNFCTEYTFTYRYEITETIGNKPTQYTMRGYCEKGREEAHSISINLRLCILNGVEKTKEVRHHFRQWH